MAIGRLSDDLGVRNFRDGKIILRDGSPTPNELEILGAEGDLSFSETAETNTIRSRGKIVGRSAGDETEMSVTFTVKFEQWSYESGDLGISPRDAFKQTGGAALWISTAPCGPYSIDIVYQAENPCGPGVEELVFPKAHSDDITFTEGDEFNTLAVTASCLAPSPVRTFIP